MHFGSTKWIVIACSTGIYIGIDKCSGPQGNTPTSPPLSVGLTIINIMWSAHVSYTGVVPNRNISQFIESYFGVSPIMNDAVSGLCYQ